MPEKRRVISVVSRRQASRNAIMRSTMLITAKSEYGIAAEDYCYLRPHEKCIRQTVHDRKWFMPDYVILAGTKIVSLCKEIISLYFEWDKNSLPQPVQYRDL